MNIENYKNIPIVIFSMNERTLELCVYCLKKLGFNNIIIDDSEISFSEKLLNFFELANDKKYNKYDLFLRTDADRLIFDGIFKLIEESYNTLKKNNLIISEGYGYEKFMENTRGATPHIYSRELMLHIVKNKNSLIKEVQKPESFIGKYCRDHLRCYYFFNCLTNLHEFGQRPSKMYNAFTNRINRGHIGLYNLKNIIDDEFYGMPMKLAIENYKINKKNTMSYKKREYPEELNILDNKLGNILDITFEYKKYLKLYYDIIKKYDFK